jgi:hypothetical protein
MDDTSMTDWNEFSWILACAGMTPKENQTN